ncbi:cell surface glycoprotein 1 isoform X2 [Coregonus clupeaformis]|uniref:cell surface glycoprotein 1 isoform X2 n=1 Tax=Coregonus clupeaformis TaxID=59861 RepID=UPI001BDF7B54|nr:cell surface glycoprotein 1 isoform X2 [Coregonus clupeaformis]
MAVYFFGKVIIPFLAYFFVEVTGEQQYGGLGGEITLTPKVSGQPEDILWKHNGNKVVEFDGSQNVEYGRYKGRTVLDWDSGELSIKGLTDADSGPYELEAVINGKLQYSQHEVDVIDDVAQPSVTCVVSITTPEKMDRTLLCSADLQPLTKFIWRSPGGSVSPGPELFIAGGENQESVYTCVVKNPVSEKTAEFTLKDCYAEEGSSSVLAVILSIIIILLILVTVLVLLWRWRKGKKLAEAALRKSEEEARLMKVTVQGNQDPEDDHSENTGNTTYTQKGHVKEVIELFNKQDADANSKQHTAPTGRILSPTKKTEPVQDKPTPAQPDLVTPDPTLAQPDPVTPDPTLAQPDPVTPDPTLAQPDPVTPVPTLAQPDPVTPVPTLAQPDPVTPDPTPAQPDLITLDPTLAQPDTTVTILGQPDPGTSESTLAQPDPSIPEPKEAQLGPDTPEPNQETGVSETKPVQDRPGNKDSTPLLNNSDAMFLLSTDTHVALDHNGGTSNIHEPQGLQRDQEGDGKPLAESESGVGEEDMNLSRTNSDNSSFQSANENNDDDDGGDKEKSLQAQDHNNKPPNQERKSALQHIDTTGQAQIPPPSPESSKTQLHQPTPKPSPAQPDQITTETALAQTCPITTESAPGQKDPITRETPPGQTDSAGTTDPATAQTDPGTTKPEEAQLGINTPTPKGAPLNAETEKPNQDIGEHKKAQIDLDTPGLKQENKLDQESDEPQEEILPDLYTGDGKHESESGTEAETPEQVKLAESLEEKTSQRSTTATGGEGDMAEHRVQDTETGREKVEQVRQVDAKTKVDVRKDGETNHNQRDWKEGKQKVELDKKK